MPSLPVVSGGEAVNAFLALGWQIVRRESSHVSLARQGVSTILTIPQKKELGRGLLRSQIRKAGIDVSEFIAALKS
jgi:predicted RNA binding protein YcfA (HicA-like mRNA interferase family)